LLAEILAGFANLSSGDFRNARLMLLQVRVEAFANAG
jgi:hypothetical protein